MSDNQNPTLTSLPVSTEVDPLDIYCADSPRLGLTETEALAIGVLEGRADELNEPMPLAFPASGSCKILFHCTEDEYRAVMDLVRRALESAAAFRGQHRYLEAAQRIRKGAVRGDQ